MRSARWVRLWSSEEQARSSRLREPHADGVWCGQPRPALFPTRYLARSSRSNGYETRRRVQSKC